MIGTTRSVRVFVDAQPCDMRKQHDSLTALVRDAVSHDLLSGDHRVFVGETRTRAKILFRQAALLLEARACECARGHGGVGEVRGQPFLHLRLAAQSGEGGQRRGVLADERPGAGRCRSAIVRSWLSGANTRALVRDRSSTSFAAAGSRWRCIPRGA